ncbi:MAG: gamma-glutamyltransferase [Anaerolineae bacterium]|nr:gamma-glutamyltransferase [Anaerolineae bacterium]NUQ03190.1 gamma-glutamyltransferase [Anaerolineae bacterium]
MSFDFRSRRSMITAQRGMVATSNPLASQAGLAILREGGNAADAAIAAAAVLHVTEPASTGMGGDMFALYYEAASRQVTALNGSGRAPAALTAEDLRRQGMTDIPIRSPHAVSVPGAVAGWEDLLKRHGTMPLARVLVDAITYAESGCPVHPIFAAAWRRAQAFLRESPSYGEFLPGGCAPEAGQVVTLNDLAKTLRAVAEGGAAAFYTGSTAEKIVSTLQAFGGVMTLDDLKGHTSTWDEPLHVDYRGVTIYECPPNGQGIVALQALKILQAFDLASMPWESPERLHLMVEALRLAFADARQYVADMSVQDVPVEWLLSDAYAAERRALIRPDAAMQPPSYGIPLGGSDTVYLSAVDGSGNACSFINSLFTNFGSGIMVPGTGVFLQSRAALFSLQPGNPNELAPNKRPYHTIIPAMATRDGALFASFGVMGDFMQPQGHVQVISALLDDDLNPQEALNRPRWRLEDGTGSSQLALEEGIPVASMARLAEMGHRVRPVSGQGRGVFGDGQIIMRDAGTGVLFGGSDPRKDGQTAAF